MHPKLLAVYKQHNRRLQSMSFANYRSLIERLCQAHSHEDWSQKILGLINQESYDQLLDYADSLLLQKYSSAELCFSASQIASIIRKYPWPKGTVTCDPTSTAVDKWLQAERRCAQTNAKFRSSLFNLEGSLSKMRAFIKYVIGETPELDRIIDRCSFTPGASIGVHGNATNIARKIASDWSVSSSAFDYAYRTVSMIPQMFAILCSEHNGIICLDGNQAFARFKSRVAVVEHNKIAFVPKTARVDRPIAVEPFLNGFVQKGIDEYMRQKLSRVGLDLSDQSMNQKWAREGSLDDSEGGFVTIDLSSASDSIAIEVVKNLLPHDWFYLLDRIRSKQYVLNGGLPASYEKFCSMGNGFCFPLETLLFAAACAAVGSGVPGQDFLVYGDDIIVRKLYAAPLIALLDELGFAVNSGKTFLEGPFRESCGADWFGGEDVRPFTLDYALDSIECVFKFLNLSERNLRSKAFFLPVRDFVRSLLPKEFDFKRPFTGSADSAYQVSLDEFMTSPFAVWNRFLQCWGWSELVQKPCNDKWHGVRDAKHSHLIAALTGATSNSPFTVRRKTKADVRRVAHG